MGRDAHSRQNETRSSSLRQHHSWTCGAVVQTIQGRKIRMLWQRKTVVNLAPDSATAEQDTDRSARSQRSMLLEEQLRAQDKRFANAIAIAETQIAELEAEKSRLAEQIA